MPAILVPEATIATLPVGARPARITTCNIGTNANAYFTAAIAITTGGVMTISQSNGTNIAGLAWALDGVVFRAA